MTATSPFSNSYAQARAQFLDAAEAASLDVHGHRHPMLGRDRETLSMDVACQGDPNAQALLLITSGCHGIEGFAGSGVQVALLRDTAWQQAVRDAGVAVLYVHALNPYGFSWWRRTTHENVDLNRNFHDFNRPLPANPGYDELAALLVPPTWPPSDDVNAALGRVLIEQGLPALQAIVSGGQHEHPQGLFYGGRNPCWSQVTLRHVLREHAGRCARLGWIDLHTGLGESGVGERIFACRDDAAALQRARAWWGNAVTSLYDGSSSSAPLTGQMWSAIYEECPQADYTGIALEYGTVPILAVIQALRADQWLENHPEADAAIRATIKRGMFEAFFTDTPHWRQRVLAQAFEAAGQALNGLR